MWVFVVVKNLHGAKAWTPDILSTGMFFNQIDLSKLVRSTRFYVDFSSLNISQLDHVCWCGWIFQADYWSCFEKCGNSSSVSLSSKTHVSGNVNLFTAQYVKKNIEHRYVDVQWTLFTRVWKLRSARSRILVGVACEAPPSLIVSFTHGTPIISSSSRWWWSSLEYQPTSWESCGFLVTVTCVCVHVRVSVRPPYPWRSFE